MPLDELIKFGLSDKEARVYLALLELEVGTAHEIASEAGVNRSSTYVVLESLKKRGLVSESADATKKRFVVGAPEKLVRIAEKAEREHADIHRSIASILPDLNMIYSGSKQKPRVRIFEGKEGVISQVEETLSAKGKILRVYATRSHKDGFMEKHMPDYLEKRARAGISLHGIHPDDSANRTRIKDAIHTDKNIFIARDKYKFTSDIVIYDNTVSFIQFNELSGIMIESALIADAMKSAFDLAFEGAKMVQK